MERLERSLLLLPTLLIGFGLRVCALADRSIWWDEGIGVWAARLPLLEAVRWTATDSHPPLYYMLLRTWRLVAGEGEFVLRFPSVVAGVLVMLLTYHLVRQLAGVRAGAAAALLMGLSRFGIAWSQEIRMYTLATAFATASLAAAVWFWRVGGGHRPWLSYVGATLGGLYTLYLGATVLLVANLGFLAAWWRRRWDRNLLIAWASAQMAVVALYVPWLTYALPRMHTLDSNAALDPGFFLQLYATMLTVGTPINLERALPWMVAAMMGLGIGAALISVRLLRRPRTTTAAQAGGFAMLLAGLLVPAFAVAVIALPGIAEGFSRPLAPRYLLPLSACYAAVAAWGANAAISFGGSRVEHRWHRLRVREIAALALFGSAVVAALAGLVPYYRGRAGRDDYVTIAEVLRASRRPEDAVVLYVDRDWPIVAAHYAGARQGLAYGAELSDPTVAEAMLAPIWDQAESVWLITTPEALQSDPSRTVPNWLATRAAVTRTVVHGESSLTLYARSMAQTAIRQTVVPGYLMPISIESRSGLVGAHIPLSRYRTGDALRLSLYWIPPLPGGCTVLVSSGEASVTAAVPKLSADRNIARTQVDVPLTADLPRGRYTVTVHVPGFAPVRVGELTLVAAASGQAMAPAAIPNPVEVRFGEAIRLLGYELPVSRIAPGDALPLTLYWTTDSALTTRYKVFTHLLGEAYNATTSNFLWGQQDNEPGSSQAPTTLWTPKTVIVDNYRIPVAQTAPTGAYTLEIGLYGLTDGKRLAVSGPPGAVHDGALHLATITITRPSETSSD